MPRLVLCPRVLQIMRNFLTRRESSSTGKSLTWNFGSSVWRKRGFQERLLLSKRFSDLGRIPDLAAKCEDFRAEKVPKSAREGLAGGEESFEPSIELIVTRFARAWTPPFIWLANEN